MRTPRLSKPMILGILLALGSSAPVFAAPKDCRNGPANTPAVFQLQGLTEQQRTQLEQVRTERRAAMRQHKQALRENRKALRTAQSKGADLNAIRPLADKQGELVAAMVVQRAQARQKVDAILTAEQKRELATLKRQRQERPRHRGW